MISFPLFFNTRPHSCNASSGSGRKQMVQINRTPSKELSEYGKFSPSATTAAILLVNEIFTMAGDGSAPSETPKRRGKATGTATHLQPTPMVGSHNRPQTIEFPSEYLCSGRGIKPAVIIDGILVKRIGVIRFPSGSTVYIFFKMFHSRVSLLCSSS